VNFRPKAQLLVSFPTFQQKQMYELCLQVFVLMTPQNSIGSDTIFEICVFVRSTIVSKKC